MFSSSRMLMTLMLAGWLTMTAGDLIAQSNVSYRSKLEALRRQREKSTKSKATATADPADWTSDDGVDYIDSLLDEEWKALGFPVSDPCTDGEFVRRVTLDIIGRVPTYEESEAFLKDASKDRKVKLINRLLASPEYGKHWATYWTRLLVTDGQEGREVSRANMRAWLEKEFNRNTPWNEMVTQMLAGRGRWDENGAVNFMIANIDRQSGSAKAVSYMSRLFLCVQTQCTECHNHPWNEWKQEQFHGIRAFFTNTRERRTTKTGQNGQEMTDYIELNEDPIAPSKQLGTFFELRNGLTQFVPPVYLDGRDLGSIRKGEKARPKNVELTALDNASSTEVEFKFADELPSGDANQPVYLREELARVITSDDNPYFARAIVNRVWHQFFGHSFIKNVDDFDNGQDEPTMPVLLDQLAQDFRDNGHNLKRLIRWMAVSKAYGLSTKQKVKGKDAQEAVGFYVFQLCEQMTPEELFDSVMTVTQYQKTSKQADTSALREQFLREFRRTFGTNEVPTGAPKFDGTITSSLMMMNSDLMKRATSSEPGSYLHTLATDKKLDIMEKVNRLYVAALSRSPNGAEKAAVKKMVANAKSEEQQQQVLQDVLWVILNSAEFILNH